MELRYLRYFVAVAERKHFTRAAEELHVAQPAVSQQIKALEDEIGVPLLVRDKRSVRLTPAGLVFLNEARAVLAQAGLACERARSAARGEIGSLAIGCFALASSRFLPELVRTYRHKFPSVRVSLVELSPERLEHALAREEIDLALTRPLRRSVADRFVQERIYRDHLHAALPQKHPLAKSRVLRLADAAAEDFVLFRRSDAPDMVDQMTGLCARAGFAPRVVSDPPSMHTVLMAVAAGIGISLVPGCVCDVRPPGVVFRPVHPASPPIDLVMATRKGDSSPTVSAWRDLVHEHLPKIRAKMEM